MRTMGIMVWVVSRVVTMISSCIMGTMISSRIERCISGVTCVSNIMSMVSSIMVIIRIAIMTIRAMGTGWMRVITRIKVMISDFRIVT